MAGKIAGMSEADRQLLRALIKQEIADFGSVLEDAMNPELAQIQAACHGFQKNIMKLQAQVTAINEALVTRGIVSRTELYRRQAEELEKLEQKALAKPAAQQAMPDVTSIS